MSGPECPKCSAKPFRHCTDGSRVCFSCGFVKAPPAPVKWVELDPVSERAA